MFATVTIKLEAQSKAELTDKFGSTVRLAQEHWRGLHEQGVLGPKENVELRFLLKTGTWDVHEPELATPEATNEP